MAAVLQPGAGAPGVFVQGREIEVVPPLASAITGLVGVAQRGPLHLPQPLREWGDYLKVFGDAVPYGYLAEATYAFFVNGGEQCYVVRVADIQNRSGENPPGACRRIDLLGRAQNQDPIDDANNAPTLRLAAVDEGSWGNAITYAIAPGSQPDMALTELALDAAPTDTTVQVANVYDFTPGGALRLTHRDDHFVRQPFVVQAIDDGTSRITVTPAVGTAFPKGSAVSGRGFRLTLRYQGRQEEFDNLSINPAHPRYVVDLVNGDPAVTSYLEKERAGNSLLVRVDQVRDSVTGRSRFTPAPTPVPPGVRSLAGAGDGSAFAHGTFTDAAGAASIT